ncbi:uncharacterized protein TNCV_2033941 [Trichonephila clavipes]|nr:uncharacterized protein TNCV_2033941 [Trichonephila clavipes]
MCKADVRKGLEDGLAMRLPLSEPREIYKDKLETDNRSNVGSEFNFEIDLPGKRDRSTIYRLNLMKLYRRKPELANLVMENSSGGIDSETLFDPGTIALRQKDINLPLKPFKIKTCCSFQMLINSLQEDTEYLLDLGVNGMGQSNRTLPVVWLGRVNRYPYTRIKCIKYRNLNQVTRAEIYLLLKRESLVEKINATTFVTVLDLWKWYFRRSLMMNYSKHTTCVMPVGMYIIKKSRFKFLCAYYGCNLTTLILRLLEQIDVSRMVDIDILIQIWKNRVKKIDFVLKWLSKVGSEVGPTKVLCEGDTRNRWRDGQVCPDVGQGTMAPWARRLGCVLACYAQIGRGRREEEKKKDGGEDRRDGERKGLGPGLEWKDDERRWR